MTLLYTNKSNWKDYFKMDKVVGLDTRTLRKVEMKLVHGNGDGCHEDQEESNHILIRENTNKSGCRVSTNSTLEPHQRLGLEIPSLLSCLASTLKNARILALIG